MTPLSFYSLLLLLENNLIFMNQSQLLPGQILNLQDKLFGELAEKYATRNGGYTRIVKIGERKGDAAMEVIIELV